LPLSAVAAHYMSAYGIYIDADMARNVFHTDAKESSELIGWQMLPALLSSLPALALLWWVRLKKRRWPKALLTRLVLLGLAAVIAGVAVFAASQPLSAMLRNQRETRYLATPANIVVAAVSLLKQHGSAVQQPRAVIGADAVQQLPATGRKPRLVLLVVGETVRAANWGLNGYARQTTPELAALGAEVINFPDVRACGSNTEVSLPCMFSPQGRADYDVKTIRSQQSLLHVLEHAGIATLWRDNQSGCKGVCEGLALDQLDRAQDPALCRDGRCFDEILLSKPEAWLGDGSKDRLVVLHMLGNHGPSYYQRVPEAFTRFTPVCANDDLGKCTQASIVNAYDNAVLYTDHVLARAIDELKTQQTYDAALLYFSDHGESLGEKGLYLHGMPHAIAPDEQMQVPMIWWMSPGFAADTGLDAACLQAGAGKPHSHDNLFHSVLGLFDVQTAVRKPGRDMFAGCRAHR
ncbi:MAG: phosphoethanolamine--lipid A transferase, partial [Pseudomonadota bacterium]|nr:phosphoethanolamine--lipid A transferase [Pseudomonadota bacterium]